MTEGARTYGGQSADQRRAERRERLVEAGLDSLGREGWAGTTVRGVCARAGLTERYFYESFGDRGELLAAIFDRVTAEASTVVVAAVQSAPDDARAKAQAAIGAFVELVTDDPRRARAILVESLDNPELRGRRELSMQAFAALVSEQGRQFYGDRAVGERDAELTALALVGAVGELVVRWLDGALDVSRERLVDHLTEVFVAVAGVSSRD